MWTVEGFDGPWAKRTRAKLAKKRAKAAPIKALRKSGHWTAAELAVAFGVTEQTIYNKAAAGAPHVKSTNTGRGKYKFWFDSASVRWMLRHGLVLRT